MTYTISIPPHLDWFYESAPWSINPPACPLSVAYQVPSMWESATLLLYAVGACALSFSLVARVWKSHYTACQEEQAECYETPFACQYPFEEATDVSGALSVTSYVQACTPSNGLVLMNYDEENEQFNYWGSRGVSYEHLETVARKYITTFQCARIYRDAYTQEQEYKERKEKEKEEKEQKEKEAEQARGKDKDDGETGDNAEQVDEEDTKDTTDTKDCNESVFATLKKYNSGTQSGTQTGHRFQSNTGSDNASAPFIPVRNHYVHKGSVQDWYTNQLQTKHIPEDEKDSTTLDFAKYKALLFGSA